MQPRLLVRLACGWGSLVRERGPQISSYAGAGSGWGTTGPGTVVDDAGTWIRRGVEEARILGDAVSKVAASGRGGTWRCTLHLDQIPETACFSLYKLAVFRIVSCV